MKRLGFLPVFFFVLVLAFAVALFLRIRSHQRLSGSVATSASQPASVPQDVIESETVLEYGTITPSVASQPDYDSIPLLDPVSPVPAVPPQRLLLQPSATAPPPITTTRREPAGSVSSPAPAVAPPPAAARRESGESRSAPSRTGPGREVASQGGEREARGGGTAGDPSPAQEPDPTSDSTPPQLLSIEFLPPQVADGEETMLVLHATDDLSGIRSISGTIVAPSGAVQGFATVREGDSSRYVARIVVPKEAAEGLWAVNYLNLLDNASNAAALTAARGALPPGASFRVVSSRPDSQGPTLEAIWIDRRSMRGGEKNLIHVRANDDKSGVNLVSGIFQSPSRSARVGFVCRASGASQWSCELAAPACADCGDWQLEQLQMQDKANNITTLRANQSELVAAIRIDITSDLCDGVPPAMQSLLLDRNAVSNAGQSTITVTARLSDDGCGVLSVSGQATGPQSSGTPPRLYFSFTAGSDPATWTGRLVVPQLASKGVWRISFIQVVDRGQNLKAYTQNDPLLANATFEVQ